jgi:Uma2 family endonuclease
MRNLSVTHLAVGSAILGHAPTSTLAEESREMAMPRPSTAVWTLEKLHDLPDDGNKYEVVHGELFVTPAPTQRHETILARVSRVLTPYVIEHKLGLVYHPRAVVRHDGSEVEPDLMVRPEPSKLDESWDRAPIPLLVLEVVSPVTRRRDYNGKRALYGEAGVPEYWVADADRKSVLVIKPGQEDVTVADTLMWSPRPEVPPLVISLSAMFADSETEFSSPAHST